MRASVMPATAPRSPTAAAPRQGRGDQRRVGDRPDAWRRQYNAAAPSSGGAGLPPRRRPRHHLRRLAPGRSTRPSAERQTDEDSVCENHMIGDTVEKIVSDTTRSGSAACRRTPAAAPIASAHGHGRDLRCRPHHEDDDHDHDRSPGRASATSARTPPPDADHQHADPGRRARTSASRVRLEAADQPHAWQEQRSSRTSACLRLGPGHGG